MDSGLGKVKLQLETDIKLWRCDLKTLRFLQDAAQIHF